MKPALLANENFPSPAVEYLRVEGYDVLAVIFFRLASYRPEDPGRILAKLLSDQPDMDGQFVVVEDHGIRKRPLPSGNTA